MLRLRWKHISLRLRGVVVHPTATIDPHAILEPSGGRIVIGARTFVDRGVIIRSLGGTVLIGDDCAVNAYSVIYGNGGLRIGNQVRIAAHSVLVPSNHNYSNPDVAITEQGLTNKGIVVEDDVWIGAGAKILDGVYLRHGTVVGAGAVVTRTTDDFAVVAGVPAKKIGSRKDQ